MAEDKKDKTEKISIYSCGLKKAFVKAGNTIAEITKRGE
jgi:hypothetical protein